MAGLSSSDILVTRARVRAVAGMLLAMTILGIFALFATAHGTIDAMGRPIGTDFSNVWSAGWMALHGQAPLAWDWGSHYAAQQAIHGDSAIPFYPWPYPPPFLLVATALAGLPYIAALIAWQSITLAMALLLVRAILPGHRDAMLMALGAPVTLICLGHGQNAFLTAALLGGGMLLLDRRPWIAGALLGALVYKPQFALLIPVLIAARGNPRAFLSAGLTAGALCLATLAVWGWPVWQAFLASLGPTRNIIIEGGDTGWEKIPSLFSAIRMWGGGVPIAWGAQSLMTVCAIAVAALVARRGSMEVRGAAALSAALLCTPYVLDYDFVLLGVAVAFLFADGVKRGMLRWEPSWLAYAWIAPLIGRAGAAFTHIPLNLIGAVAVLYLAARRAALFDGAFALPQLCMPATR